MNERTRAMVEEDLERFHKEHSPQVAAVVGVGIGLVPGVLAASHNLELFVSTTVAAAVVTIIHLDNSKKTLASLQEELKRIGTEPIFSDNNK